MPRRPARVRAPELRGRGGWINTPPLTLAGLRGTVVLLDFWTSCCVNCLHVLAELRPVQERFGDALVTISVHSPKFPHEAEHEVVQAAVQRWGVSHPVLDDPDRETWDQYAVHAWPTLVVVDPAGSVAHVATGEGHAGELAQVLAGLIGQPPRASAAAAPTPTGAGLRFPAGAARLPGGDVVVADAGHDSLAVLRGDHVVRRLGSGRLRAPQGLCVLGGGDLLVADTGSHRLLRLDPVRDEVTVVAGTGEQWRPGDPLGGPALQQRLASPWDVVRHDGEVVIAMAGTHQLWALGDGVLRVLAGTGREGLRDGPAELALLAQPSALAPGGARLWFVDAETSALRWLADGQVQTAVGTGLFAFGHTDGVAGDALLQHPLGVTVRPDGTVVVCDTYNGALRAYDPATGRVTTLATGLVEPTAALPDGAGLLVVESAAHRTTRVAA